MTGLRAGPEGPRWGTSEPTHLPRHGTPTRSDRARHDGYGTDGEDGPLDGVGDAQW